MRFRIPLAFKVGAVAVLFIAAIATLWQAGASAVRRDRRRSETVQRLEQAEDALAARGASGLVYIPEWPETLDADGWAALDAWLATEAGAALSPFPGVEGGFYVPSFDRYVGYTPPAGPTRPKSAPTWSGRNPSDPPPRERALIEAQIFAALDQDRPLTIVVETPPHALALRTAPVWVNDRKVAATWTLARLDEGPSIASSIAGYRTAAALAMAGIVLALLLTLDLARTVRRQGLERERLQAELRRGERLAALGKLLAGVAHEVRNPLAGIRSTAQLWQRGVPPDDDSAADLIVEVDRLDGIVSRLLQFSRADTQELSPGDLNDVVVEAARLVRPAAEAQQVLVELDLEPGLPPLAMSAPALLQVFRNLTTNALQAMPRGGTLRLSTRIDPSRRTVEVAIADTGEGLTREVESHLFEPFFTTKPDGTGLGLAIAREIALAHHGDLHAENRRDGPGAVFVVTLPVHVAQANGKVPQPFS